MTSKPLVVKRGERVSTPQPKWKHIGSQKRVLQLDDLHRKLIEPEVAIFRALYEKLANGWQLHSVSREHRNYPRGLVEAALAELMYVFPKEEIAGRLAYIVSDEERFASAMKKLQFVSDALAVELSSGGKYFAIAVAATTPVEANTRSSSVTHDFHVAKRGGQIVHNHSYAATLASARAKWLKVENPAAASEPVVQGKSRRQRARVVAG